MSLTALASRFGGSDWFGPVVVAVIAWVAVVVALDPTGDHPRSRPGPGMTVDESFNVAQGAALADRMLAFDLDGFRQVDARLPDHPPLGRIAIGLCHELAYLVWPPVDRTVPYSVTCARTAPACAFAVLIALVGNCAGRWSGRVGGVAAALAVALMPRTFGHAHLAALESMVNLTLGATVLYLATRWGDHVDQGAPHDSLSQRRSFGLNRFETWSAVAGGVLLGLALLTKVQAVLLPIPIALWAVWHNRWRGLLSIGLWGGVGVAMFMACWPHLWDAPLDNLLAYLGRTTNRAVILVWYFHQSVADRDVAWHYPWVMFLTTVPVGLHALGLVGCFAKKNQKPRASGEWLVLGCVLFPLLVFSIPGVAVYDGERLFSFVFPLWGVFVGRGAAWVWNWGRQRLSVRTANVAGIAFLISQAYGVWAYSPAWLSYYNLGVGGLAGAARNGLEVSYWGDGVTRDLLQATAKAVPQGGVVAVLPTLHPAQWKELEFQTPALKTRGIRLVPWGTVEAEKADYLLIFSRSEYLPDEFRGTWDERRIVAETRRGGVILAALLTREPHSVANTQ